MSPWIGKTLGKVSIDSLIARGGMAVVYLGTHQTLQREVVVKILRNDFEEDAASLERFQREARVVAKLRHPNIVQIFDFDTVEDQPYIVMEYIQGPSLSRYLSALHKKLGRLELPEVSRVLTGVANALQYAHESGVIHRDVKPANILLASRSSSIVPGESLPVDFEPILTDFGLVRFLNTSMQTSTGKIVGTPAYMSPEQALGESTDERTDVYSLGIVLYEMMAGHVPFDGETTMGILLKHINEPPPPILGLAFGFQYVLDRALEKKPEKRFQTPGELAAAFNEVLEETSGASTLVHLPHRAKFKRTEKTVPSRWKWVGAALSTVMIGALGASIFLNGRSSPTPGTQTPTMSATTTVETLPTHTASPLPLGPTGSVRFQDGNAILDEVNITALAMPAPPEGFQFEAWLVSASEERLNLGRLTLDKSGRGTLTYTDPEHRNLLALYDGIEITMNPVTETSTFEQIAYSYALPGAGLQYMRQLLVSFSPSPQQVALIQGISANSQLIIKASEEMVSAYESGDQGQVQKNAEVIMNLLAGSQSQQYKDWNADGQITDPGDGYGFLINGNNLGYIQATYAYADYVANSPGASQNMIVNGENVKICAQNLAQWASQLRDQAMTILSPESSEAGEIVLDAAGVADRMLNGIDEDNDGVVEPVSGECGVGKSYDYAYRMADMPLLPVNQIDTLTTTPTTSVVALPTRTPARPQNQNPSVTNPPVIVNTPAPPGNPNPQPNPPENQPTRRPPRSTRTPRN